MALAQWATALLCRKLRLALVDLRRHQRLQLFGDSILRRAGYGARPACTHRVAKVGCIAVGKKCNQCPLLAHELPTDHYEQRQPLCGSRCSAQNSGRNAEG